MTRLRWRGHDTRRVSEKMLTLVPSAGGSRTHAGADATPRVGVGEEADDDDADASRARARPPTGCPSAPPRTTRGLSLVPSAGGGHDTRRGAGEDADARPLRWRGHDTRRVVGADADARPLRWRGHDTRRVSEQMMHPAWVLEKRPMMMIPMPPRAHSAADMLSVDAATTARGLALVPSAGGGHDTRRVSEKVLTLVPSAGGGTTPAGVPEQVLTLVPSAGGGTTPAGRRR